MKIGGPGIGYTSGTLYKRHDNVGYTPGSKYKRFGKFGLLNQRNLTTMNRQAIDGYRSAVASSGLIVFGAKQIESEGYSELAAYQVLARVKAAANELVAKSETLSLANGGSGGGKGTGNTVDETV